MLMILLFTHLEKMKTQAETFFFFKVSLQKWFYDNYMALNPGKCYYMSSGSNPNKSDLILGR